MKMRVALIEVHRVLDAERLEVVDAAFHAAGLPMRVEREAINLSTLLAFAELGLGVPVALMTP